MSLEALDDVNEFDEVPIIDPDDDKMFKEPEFTEDFNTLI